MKIKLLLLSIGCMFVSCVAIKPHEMVYLNDSEMQLGNGDKNFEIYIESIREGATPAGSGKASGGCGCN